MKSNDSASPRVMIVDDEPNIVTAIDFLMQQQGFQTASAYNGAEALRMMEAFQPDLLILDVMMPVMDGYEVASSMRKEDKWAGTKIIFLTAKGAEKDKSQGYGAGADVYLTKPFDNKALVEKVRDSLDLDW
ncbi:MAG: response regulator [Bacteroidia bacterium]|nr:response regulator [Bacteroidia bacterium]